MYYYEKVLDRFLSNNKCIIIIVVSWILYNTEVESRNQISTNVLILKIQVNLDFSFLTLPSETLEVNAPLVTSCAIFTTERERERDSPVTFLGKIHLNEAQKNIIFPFKPLPISSIYQISKLLELEKINFKFSWCSSDLW